MPDERSRLQLSREPELSELPASLFLARVLDEQVREVRVENWPTSATSLAELGEAQLRVRIDERESAVYERDGVLVEVDLVGGRVFAAAAHAAAQRVEAELAALRQLLPPPDVTARHEVPVTFWTYGPHGPQPAWRSIAVPGWDEIRENYTPGTREPLERLMRGFQPAHGGQLILWHGKAGTGKTFGLRALAWEWRDWCELHYIVDPDAFFGQHADYLISVLLQPGYGWTSFHPGMAAAIATRDDLREVMLDEGDPNGGGDGEESRKPWRVLLLEDTGELLTADARVSLGQGLSRFLNVVDGLIGQGLRVLVLVTTNEEIRRLHPAVARPGRCAANVEFLPLEAEEASRWLARHGVDDAVTQPTLLASLYARLEQFGVPPVERVTGFAGDA